MKRLIVLPFFFVPSLVLAQAPDPMAQLPTSLIQKLWAAASKAPYDQVRPLEDELNRALHPPAPPSAMGPPVPRDNRTPGPSGGPGEPPSMEERK